MSRSEWITLRIVETESPVGVRVPLKVGLVRTPRGAQVGVQVGDGPVVILRGHGPAELVIHPRAVVMLLYTGEEPVGW